MKKLRWVLLGLLCFASLGCGGGNDGFDPGDPILPIGRIEGYVLNADFGGGIGVARINGTTGELTAVSGSPFATAGVAQNVALPPGGRFVYAPARGDDFLQGFALEPSTGALTPLDGFPVPTVQDGFASFLTYSYLLYVTGESEIDGFRVNETTGSLTRLNGFPLAVPGMVNAQTQQFSVNGRFLYIADRDTDQIFIFACDTSTGALTARGQVSSGAEGPTTLGADPSGNFILVAHADGTLVTFRIANNGGLSQEVGTVYADAPALTFRMDFVDDVVYLGNASDGSLNAFRLTQAGTLLSISGFPRAGGGGSVLVFPFPYSPFLYTSDRNSNRIFGYLPSATGGVSAIPNSPFSGTGQPTWLEAAVVSF